jgi:hypothetical protein
MAENKFPTEVIDLPSEGKFYPDDSPLKSGKLELKYMTAKEEDILTSQNLIKKGVVIDKLLENLIITPNVHPDDMILGDKNAVMVAARILAYGPEYPAEVTNPNTEQPTTHIFNLADCPFKKANDDVSENKFTVKLPVGKQTVEFKVLTGKEEKQIDLELTQIKKYNPGISRELTTRLKHSIISIDGNADKLEISKAVDNMLSRDSLYLRNQIKDVSPDIIMQQTIDMEGEEVKVDIPMTVNFFWPES